MGMNRRAFLSWGTVGVGALCSAVAVSMAAVGRFLVPSVFYEPPQSFKIGSPADFPFGPPTFMADEKIFVLHGPAPRPLNWFEVTLARDGKLNIDKDKIVPSSDRLMV